MDLAAILLIVSLLLVLAIALLTVSVMRIRRTAYELQKALAESSGSRERADMLLAVASAVNSSLALEDVLNVALSQACDIMDALAGAMYLVAPGKTEMRRQAEHKLIRRARGSVRKLEEEPLRSALSVMKPTFAHLSADTAPGLESGGRPPAVIVVPIQRSGQLMGAMELYLPGPLELSNDQVDLLQGVAAQTAIAIRHAQLFQAQEENALTDELTRLPNRRYMAQRYLQEMQRARRYHKPIAFLMVDLDHFKEINDSHGHLTGDAMLAELATLLATGARESDVCARYGGEEFGMILHETNESGALILAERLRAKVEQATFPNGMKLTVSIGIAATDDTNLFTSLIERADEALYAAKQDGRNQVRVADMKAAPATRQHA